MGHSRGRKHNVRVGRIVILGRLNGDPACLYRLPATSLARCGAPLVLLGARGSVLVHRVVLLALVHRAEAVLLALGGSILVHRVVLLVLVRRVVLLARGGSVLVHRVIYLALVG